MKQGNYFEFPNRSILNKKTKHYFKDYEIVEIIY